MLRKLALGLIIVVGAAMATLGWLHQQFAKPLNIEQRQLFTLTPGQGAIETLMRFEQQGWLPMPTLAARLWLKLVYGGQPILAGTYAFEPPLTLAGAFELLSHGEEVQFDISLIEGQTYQQWLTTLKAHPRLKADLTANEEALVQRLIAEWQPYSAEPLNSLEGLLLADTYHFTNQTPASEILKRASAAMQDYLLQKWAKREPGLPYEAPVEVLTMASIIEKETALASERARIAGVFVNRLEQNMRLQTDPTVIYGLGDRFDGNLTRQHLREDTPYNTYVHKGLPPGPIAMIGRVAIDAALQPALTSELYFVARGDGSHQFSNTLEQHNQAVREFQLNRKDGQP